MESNQSVNLYVTYVDKEGPFLKIWGQAEKNNAIYVEQFLSGISQHFDAGIGKVAPETLQPGTLVCAKYKDNKYYRARIINVCIQDTFVEVSFVDFGNKDIVTSGNIRSLQNLPSSFISVPPLAVGFIFAEAHCMGGCIWDDRVFDIISKDLKYREVQCQLLIQATQYFLVKIYLDGTDLCSNLIHRTLMQPITLQAQQAVLLSMSLQKQMVQQQVSPIQTTAATINTYKACTLEPGCQYQVYVSYVNDGPCQFSVQLKQTEDALAKLMSDINTLPLKLLEDLPIPGTICLAKCQEDDSVCRAVVTNEVDNQFKVFYVDFGNYEVVPIEALYQIPFKYVIPKVMAIRYALEGVDKSTLTIEMQLAFKKFVDNRLLHMKVLPTPTRMAIPKCELWDPETKTSALDVVNRAAVHAYPESIALSRGFSQSVKVSFVYSCSRFYVQLSSNEAELANLMTELQLLCQSMYDTLDPSVMKVGLPCCALFEGDQLWYRSQIVAVLGDRVQVRYIDYGNEEDVPVSQLKCIDGEPLTVLRPQAIECCLNGYQNMEDDPERNALLENIILEGTFTMKVVDMVDKKALVDLYDGSDYNVASLLLDKIAAISSQVSPILVQAGDKIEHRKSPKEWQNTGREQNFRGDRERNSGRESYSRNERSTDRSDKPWRQNNRENRNFENLSENNERDTWRQNNKGFSPNHQRPDNREKTPRGGDSWGGAQSPKAAPGDSWGSAQSPKAAPGDAEWGGAGSTAAVNNDEWATPANEGGHRGGDRRTNDYGRRRGGYDRDNRGDRHSGNRRDDGFRKTPDYRGGGSDSGSEEKGYRKGPRTSSRNDRGGRDRHTDARPPRRSPSVAAGAAEDSWNVSAVAAPIDAAPATAAFAQRDVVGTEATVAVSWFHHPGLFYCQLVEHRDEFRLMVEDIQHSYKGRQPEPALTVGAPIIALFPEDKVLYRAQALETGASGGGQQHKVFFVDFGNVSSVGKVWPVERRFMALPAHAVACGLRGVQGGQGGGWGEPDLYAAYFDKESFRCRFVEKEEDRILVDIFHDSEDVAQQLVRDGLAVPTQPAVPAIEIPLLCGQQLRATLMSINNLADIIIVLECGLAVNCAVHNLESATGTFEDTLKGVLQQPVIVYVDDVKDDKLEVTFYTPVGTKLTIVEPDEGAFDTVDLPCPAPILTATLRGYVSYADASCACVQPAECSDQLAQMLDALFEACEGQAPETAVAAPEVGRVYAVRSGDGNWYRGRVTGLEDGRVEVRYVDYGNSEGVEVEAVRELDGRFLDVSEMSLQIIVPDAESFLDKDVIATVTLGPSGWEGTLTVSDAALVENDINQDSGDTGFGTSSLEKPESELLVPTETDESNTIAEESQEVEVQAEVASEELQNSPVIGQPVYASHVDSPNEFYLQFTESLASIDALQAELQQLIEEMPVLESPAVGTFCAAPYSVDQQWYRAEILDADDDITTVRFVDFGNTDVIDNAATRVRTLPPRMLALALYASRCSLKVEPKDGGEWSATALELFERLATADSLTAEFLEQNERTSFVELRSDGASAAELLLAEGVARQPAASSTSAPVGPATGFVSHANSPDEFWMQMEACVDELEWIAEQLSTAETFPELDDLTPGTLCAALFPDDQQWYRARILSTPTEDTTTTHHHPNLDLLFIDYGNSSSCPCAGLRQLPEDLVATAPLAQKCRLQRPEGGWPPEAAGRFADVAMQGQTVFAVRRIAADETSTVRLLLDGKDVAEMLVVGGEMEEGFVREAETLQSLRVEKASGEAVNGELVLEPMPGQDLNEEAAKKFEEINEQGSTLFQIEFVNESTIRLYLNGQDIRPMLGGMQNASLDISQTETLIEDTEKSQDADEDNNSSLPNVCEIVQDLQTEVFNKIEQTEVDSDQKIPVPLDSEPHTDEEIPLIIDESQQLKEDDEEPRISVEPSEDAKDSSLSSPEDVINNLVVQSTDVDLGQKVEEEKVEAWQLSEQPHSEQVENVILDHEEQPLNVPECHTSPNPEDVTSTADVESSNIEHEQDTIKLEECHTNQISDNVLLPPTLESSKSELESENLDSLQSHADGEQKILVLSEEKSENHIILSQDLETSETGPEDMTDDTKDLSNEVSTEPKLEKQAEVDEKTGQTEIFEDNTVIDDSDNIHESPELEIADCLSNASTSSPSKSSPTVSTQNTPNSSKVSTPKKTIEKSSPTKESPKKDSPTKVSPNSPIKVSSNSLAKVSPKKESAKVSTMSPSKVSPNSPVKVSPKKDSAKVSKMSPSKVSPNSPVKVPPKKESAKVSKMSPSKVSPNSPVKVSPKKESAEISPNKESPVKVSAKRQPSGKEAGKSPKTSPVKELSPKKKSPKEPEDLAAEVPLDRDTEPVDATSECPVSTNENDKGVPAGLSMLETPSEGNAEVEAIMKIIDEGLNKEIGSRPQSSCSGRMSFDEKIVPACISRPETPVEVKSRPQSSCSGKLNFDDMIVPACYSKPGTPDEGNVEVEAILKTILKRTEDGSRPHSSCSGKISSDEEILPSISIPASAVKGDCEVAATLMNENIDSKENEVEHRPETSNEGNVEVDAILKTILERTEVGSRTHSFSSGKISSDEEIVPSSISIPASAVKGEGNVEVEAILETILKRTEVGSEPQSTCSGNDSLDEGVVPSCISSTVVGDSEVATSSMTETIEKEKNELEPRPESASSGKIKYDDKIVSAVLTRPHTSVDENPDVGIPE